MAGPGLDFTELTELGSRFQRMADGFGTQVLGEVMREGAKVARNIISRAPPGGATTGAPGTTFWKRRIGSIYVSKGGGEKLVKASEDLTQTWNEAVGRDGFDVQMILESTASYAAYVMGGKNDYKQQSSKMQARGWKTTDTVSKMVAGNVTQILNTAIDTFMKNNLG